MRYVALAAVCIPLFTPPAVALNELEQKADAVFKSLEMAFEDKVETVGKYPCYQDNYCQGEINNVIVNVWGLGIVDVLPAHNVPFEDYMLACTAALSGLGNTPPKDTLNLLIEYFNAASQTGKAEGKYWGTDVKVSANYEGTLECRFFK
ncbi:hypothetical protein TRICHSKD4_1047 [Roseibium sp. TrichSKD4]|uniref:hypothetical protein n=1 Tax=Roseibium sp. TrichSKD4 TaxID=744980 RepID=UPI0001E5639E|nr:hypothetical protein [Roseibium sp. TrichSKD4]EFO33928.1 hypothetical protein TRICHSKD4_1047 [Roseibium sp. TrichSKD4]